MEVLIFLGLLLLGFFAGRRAEQRHFASIQQRERQTAAVPVLNVRASQDLPPAEYACLFVGSVVIAGDYYKLITGLLAGVVGGAIPGYESLMERGRREAILRMKEAAIAWGATQVLNVRMETASLNSNQSNSGTFSVEVIAYGTGIKGAVPARIPPSIHQ